jgi:hypothetical protein
MRRTIKEVIDNTVRNRAFPFFALIVPFLVQIALAIPYIWPQYLGWASYVYSIPLVILGILGLSGLAYKQRLDEKERLRLLQHIDHLRAEQLTKTRALMKVQIRNKLRDLLTFFKISDEGRAYIYVINDAGELGVGPEYNMIGSPDHEWTFALTKGFAGKGWNAQRPLHCNIRTQSAKSLQTDYGFTAGQARIIKQHGLQAALFAPIPKPNEPDTTIGVIVIDSKKSLDQIHFNTEDNKILLAQIATFLGGPLYVLIEDAYLETLLADVTQM